MKYAIAASALLSSALIAGPASQTFTGTITDSMCAKADHAGMRMGPTDAECTKACIDVHGATYVLYDGRETYALSDQQRPEAFAGQKVRVVGTLDSSSKTIHIETIDAAR